METVRQQTLKFDLLESYPQVEKLDHHEGVSIRGIAPTDALTVVLRFRPTTLKEIVICTPSGSDHSQTPDTHRSQSRASSFVTTRQAGK